MKKKLIALVLSAIMAAGILGGCGKSGGGVQEVDFWSAPNQGQYDYWVEKAEAFNATKTEVNGKVIEVKVQQMPESPSSEAGIQTAISTSTVPAVSENINRGFAATLAQSGVVYDIQDEDWFKEILANRAMETAVEGWKIDGKQYVIPLYINPMAFQWNVKALEALGFDAPPITQAQYEALIGAFVEEKDGKWQNWALPTPSTVPL